MSSLTVPSAAPHLRAVRSAPSGPEFRRPVTEPRPPELPMTMPEGATVVVTLPQSALTQQLLDQYGVQPGGSGNPLVGYLVLVEAEQNHPAVAPTAETHGISLDTDRRSAQVDGRPLDLTYLEFELLAHLLAHPHRVHTREHLVSAVWGYDHVGDGRTVDVHVARLRSKLGSAYRDRIVTVRRVGYKYVPLG